MSVAQSSDKSMRLLKHAARMMRSSLPAGASDNMGALWLCAELLIGWSLGYRAWGAVAEQPPPLLRGWCHCSSRGAEC